MIRFRGGSRETFWKCSVAVVVLVDGIVEGVRVELIGVFYFRWKLLKEKILLVSLVLLLFSSYWWGALDLLVAYSHLYVKYF